MTVREDSNVAGVSDVRTIHVDGGEWFIFARQFADAVAARDAVTALSSQGPRHLGVYRTASNVVIVVSDMPPSAAWAAGMVEGDTYLSLTAAEERALVLRRIDAIASLQPLVDATGLPVSMRRQDGPQFGITKAGKLVPLRKSE
jgi:hypothetical protein